MELRPLGTTGILVSPIGLGTVKLGRNAAVKYPRPFDLPTDDAARSLLDLARDLGINLLDTAPAYGTSEERLGALLAGRRDEWVISTKVGEEFDPAGAAGAGASRFDFSPAHVRASVERSLRRLRTERLDIVLVHSDGSEDLPRPRGLGHPLRAAEGDLPLDALHSLADLKREGKVRAIGFSAKTPAGARAALSGSDVLMLTLNPLEREMLPVVRECAGKGVLIKKGLISGHLHEWPRSSGWPRPSGAGAEAPAMRPDDPVEACLRFILAEPHVSCVVVGTIDADHLREDIASAERVLRR